MKQEIEIEGLPEGWRAVSYRIGNIEECCLDPKAKQVIKLILTTDVPVLIVEKTKQRRIVLEETDKKNTVLKTVDSEPVYVDQEFGSVIIVDEPKIWREAEGE